MNPHLPDLANALIFIAILIGLSLGYLWWEIQRALLVDEDGYPVEEHAR